MADKIMRNWVVRDAKDRVHRITANHTGYYGETVTFIGTPEDDDERVALFSNPISVTQVGDVPRSTHVADVHFTVKGHESDVKRLLNEWGRSRGYTLDDLEVTQTHCTWEDCHTHRRY